jgi:cell division protein FtsB
MIPLWLAIILAWLAFSLGFLAGLWWAAIRLTRRIRQDAWQLVHGVTNDRKRA